MNAVVARTASSAPSVLTRRVAPVYSRFAAISSIATVMAVVAAAIALSCALLVSSPSAYATQGSNEDAVAHAGAIGLEEDSQDADVAASTLAIMQDRPYWKSSYGLVKFTQGGKSYSVKGVKAMCIDVSQWQGDIDWNKVKLDGIEYAIIRCGYGDNLTKQDDSQWKNNVRGAQRVGIGIGVYLYSYAYNTTMATSEAKHTLRLLKAVGLEPKDLALPVYLDFEDSGAIKKMTYASTRGKVVKKYADLITAEGYPFGVYANTSHWNTKLTDSRVMDPINSGEWSRWVAHYNRYCGVAESTPSGTVANSKENYADYLDIWQFSDQGKVVGISGRVDMDFIFDEGKVPIYKAKIKTNYTSFTYNGETRMPKVTVTYGGDTLEEGVDYELVEPDPSVKVGSYTLKVKGLGKFSSSKKITYTIRPQKVAVTDIVPLKKAFKLSWTPSTVQCYGYQIRWSRTSDFSSYSSKTVAGIATDHSTVSVAKSKKKYYVKIRAYRTVDGTKYYSYWSPKVTVTTK